MPHCRVNNSSTAKLPYHIIEVFITLDTEVSTVYNLELTPAVLNDNYEQKTVSVSRYKRLYIVNKVLVYL